MRRAPSIVRQLTGSLALVGGLGALLLLVVIWIEYRISFRHLSEREAFGRAMHELGEHVLLPMAVLIVPMALAGRWAIKRGVRPLLDAAERIEARAGETRGVRIELDGFPAEARPFAEAINRTLDRIDRAAELHEAFAADIAHELRTPLTLLSLELELLDHPKAAAMQGDIAQMRRLIDQLMLLAQIEADRAARIESTPVDLADVASDVIARMAPIALDRGVRLELEVEAPLVTRGRREAIAAALRNLIENALRVTPDAGLVRVRIAAGGVVAVRDQGAGLSEARLSELVERHRRADHASRDGAGLGLAIVERIMRAHDGRLCTAPELREMRIHFPVLAASD